MESEYWSDEEQEKLKKKKSDEKETKKILRTVAVTILCLSLAFSVAALLAVLNKPITHLVSFRNYDNALIATETIKDGEVATKPDITPNKPADSVNTYSFSGWDKEFTTTIKEDTTFNAQYASTPIPVVTPTPTYTVRFLNDDTAKSVLYSCSIKSGEKASYQGVTPN
jgi:flagellar basal body-associated protein FliL